MDLLNGLPVNKFLAVRTSTDAYLQEDLAHVNSWESMGKCLTMITVCTTQLAEVIDVRDTLCDYRLKKRKSRIKAMIIFVFADTYSYKGTCSHSVP